MPPYETTGGEQTVMVDATGHIFNAMQYLNQEKQLALQGVADAPSFGFATVRNVPDHSKYPYDPFYGGLSPRVGVALNFSPSYVLRRCFGQRYEHNHHEGRYCEQDSRRRQRAG